jgi:NAD(P)-dependent dehydrogenase (short-subunit alcohol dehydrogenase family)
MGLGAVFARALAAEGAKVTLCDVNDSSPVAGDIRCAGGEAMSTITDVTSAASVAEMVAATEEVFGTIHVLVNNAALSSALEPRPFFDIPSDEWDRVMAVNARGTFECSKAVAPIMRRQRYGKIINMSSGMVFRGVPYLMHYNASKGAIIAMTRVMARELGADNICVNCIAPGLVPTASVLANPAISATRNAVVEQRAIKREEAPADLIGAVIFFASPESDFITGQTLSIDGGVAMN